MTDPVSTRSPNGQALLRRVRRVLRGAFVFDCVLCGTAPGAPDVCTECHADFLAPRPRCARCAAPLRVPAPACGTCLRRQPAFDATIVVADYAPPVDALIQALKFGHRLAFAPLLGALLADRAATLAVHPDLLVPVPLSFERLAERGFNQSLEIARPLADRLGVALDRDVVLRTKHRPAQASLLLDARRRNIRGAFAVRRALRGGHVGLVDDVMTSGSTLDELAHALKRAGAAAVTNFVVARTP